MNQCTPAAQGYGEILSEAVVEAGDDSDGVDGYHLLSLVRARYKAEGFMFYVI